MAGDKRKTVSNVFLTFVWWKNIANTPLLWRRVFSNSLDHSTTDSTCPVSNERFAASVTASVLTASA